MGSDSCVKSLMFFLQGETECRVQQMARMPTGDNKGYVKAKTKVLQQCQVGNVLLCCFRGTNLQIY